MKKLLATIALLTCLLGLTACGSSDETGVSDTDRQVYNKAATECYIAVVSTPEEQVDQLRNLHGWQWDIVTEGMKEGYVFTDGETILAGLESWWAAQEELGEIDVMEDIQSYYLLGMIDVSDFKLVEETKTTTVQIPLDGSKRDGMFEVTFDKEMNVTGITTNVNYTFGEKMTKAALNTLLGMGTVFIVLIFMCFVIYGFGLIPKLQNAFAKKKASGAEVKKEAVDNTIAQIAEREEDELSDDLELVAVISAAIAASEGAASTDGFVVRSIKRANRR